MKKLLSVQKWSSTKVKGELIQSIALNLLTSGPRTLKASFPQVCQALHGDE